MFIYEYKQTINDDDGFNKKKSSEKKRNNQVSKNIVKQKHAVVWRYHWVMEENLYLVFFSVSFAA